MVVGPHIDPDRITVDHHTMHLFVLRPDLRATDDPPGAPPGGITSSVLFAALYIA